MKNNMVDLKQLMSAQAEARNMQKTYEKSIYPHTVYLLINTDENREQKIAIYAIRANETFPDYFTKREWIPFDRRFYDFENLYSDQATAAREYMQACANAVKTGLLSIDYIV